MAKSGEIPGAGIPTACGGQGKTKAAYRFFDNEKATAQQVLEPHYQGTEQRLRQHPTVLAV